MRKWILVFSIAGLGLFPIMSVGGGITFENTYSPILSIVPDSTSAITVREGVNASRTYTVTNNTTKTVNQLQITPGYSAGSLINTTLSSNTCTTSLSAGATCQFIVTVTAGTAGTTKLMPRVCIAGGLNCSIPIVSNRITTTVEAVSLQSIAITPTTSVLRRLATQQFAATGTYSDSSTATITTGVDWSSSDLSVATIGLNTGLLAGTSSVGSTNILASLGSVTSNTVSLTFKDFAYIANYDNKTISYCPVNSNGSFATCTAVNNAGAGNNTFNLPAGIAINSDYTKLYVANYGNNIVSYCPLAADGSLSTCQSVSVTGTSLSGPSDIDFTPNGNFAYIANYDGQNNLYCSVGSNGTAFSCSIAGGGLVATGYNAVDVNPAGNYVYFEDASQILYSCSINSSTGATSSCNVNTSSAFSGFGPYGIRVHPDYPTRNFAYVANFARASNPIAICVVNTSTGTFSSCTAPSSSGVGVSFYGPSYFAFLPVDSTKIYLTDTDYGVNNQIISATVNLTDGTLSGYQSLTDTTFDSPQGIVFD